MSNASSRLELIGYSRKAVLHGTERLLAVLRRCALVAGMAGLGMSGCGTPHATFDVTGPSTATAGSPFTITVTAMVGTARDTVINSSIRFTSSDPAAILPVDYYFKANDAGSHTFTNGVTLMTPGSQSVTVTEIGVPGLNGALKVTVSLAPGNAQIVRPVTQAIQ